MAPGLQTRRQHGEITSLDTFRAILERGSSQAQDDASLKHQTSHMSEESEETCDINVQKYDNFAIYGVHYYVCMYDPFGDGQPGVTAHAYMR